MAATEVVAYWLNPQQELPDLTVFTTTISTFICLLGCEQKMVSPLLRCVAAYVCYKDRSGLTPELQIFTKAELNENHDTT